MRFMAEKRMLSSWASALRASSHLVITPISGPIASWGLMNPGMAEIRFGNNVAHKKAVAPWGQRRHFTYFKGIFDQSGDVIAAATTNAISLISSRGSRSALTQHFR